MTTAAISPHDAFHPSTTHFSAYATLSSPLAGGNSSSPNSSSSSFALAEELHHHLHDLSSRFSDYNFRNYFLRKSDYDFHVRFSANSSELAAQKYVEFAKQSIPKLERMAFVNRLYGGNEEFVIEKKKKSVVEQADTKAEKNQDKDKESPSEKAKLFSESPLHHK